MLTIRETPRPRSAPRLYAKRGAHLPFSRSDAQHSYKLPDPWTRLRTMLKVLGDEGWIFAFRVEMRSPRGWRYAGQGSLPTEAFLKAIGDWRRDITMPTARTVRKTSRRPAAVS